MNKTGKLRNKLVLLVVPRSPKLSGGAKTYFEKQGSYVLSALEKICYESVIENEGWRRLPSIVNIFEKLERGLTYIIQTTSKGYYGQNSLL